MVSMSEIESKMSFWDILHHYGVAEKYEKFHDATIPWINNNSKACVERAIKNKSYRLISKILAWKTYVCKQSNYSVPLGTIEDFEASMSYPITMWRGGAGTYNGDWSDGRTWVSFTGKRDRANTFSHYAGTNASRAYTLAKNKTFWIVELTVSIQDILLYLPQGYDEEFIIPSNLSSQAKLISTSEV